MRAETKREVDAMECLTLPCPIGCGNEDFNFIAFGTSEKGEKIFAYSCPVCGHFAMLESDRDWALENRSRLQLTELRDMIQQAGRKGPPTDYTEWPWVDRIILELFSSPLRPEGADAPVSIASFLNA